MKKLAAISMLAMALLTVTFSSAWAEIKVVGDTVEIYLDNPSSERVIKIPPKILKMVGLQRPTLNKAISKEDSMTLFITENNKEVDFFSFSAFKSSIREIEISFNSKKGFEITETDWNWFVIFMQITPFLYLLPVLYLHNKTKASYQLSIKIELTAYLSLMIVPVLIHLLSTFFIDIQSSGAILLLICIAIFSGIAYALSICLSIFDQDAIFDIGVIYFLLMCLFNAIAYIALSSTSNNFISFATCVTIFMWISTKMFYKIPVYADSNLGEKLITL
ncbi:MAG: hypothetical protein OEV93_03835 [Candidatus Moranbacteria bacterium]|nr:hypothetical protein [Candidatus Moranbacteria bacterium]